MDYYEILGVSREADAQTIKSAYRRLSLKHHCEPDRYQSVWTAYKKLSNARPGGSPPAECRALVACGENAPGPRAAPHPHLAYLDSVFATDVTITFEQAWAGCTVPIHVGVGRARETVYVVVPPGTDEGEVIRINDVGASAVGEFRPVHVAVRVANDTPFERSGLDVIYRKTLSLHDAMCGFKFDITLCGITYTICNDPGDVLQPSAQRRIPDLGIRRGAHVGALIIKFDVQLPKHASAQLIAALRAA